MLRTNDNIPATDEMTTKKKEKKNRFLSKEAMLPCEKINGNCRITIESTIDRTVNQIA